MKMIEEKKRRNKYNVAPLEKRTWQGTVFDSKGEMNRYIDLYFRQLADEIQHLQRQVSYSFFHEGEHICDYVADFVYTENGVPIVEDYKAIKTPVFMIKRKMMKAWFGIEIRLTGAAAKKRKPRRTIKRVKP